MQTSVNNALVLASLFINVRPVGGHTAAGPENTIIVGPYHKSQPHSVCAEIDGGVSTRHPTRGLEERYKPLPPSGQSPGQKWILCIFEVRKAIWNTIFNIFELWRGPQTSRDPGKLSPLNGPD